MSVGLLSQRRYTRFSYNEGVVIKGGSVVLDGTGDYLQVSNNAALQFGTDDFCVEGWCRIDASQPTNPAGIFSVGSFNNGVLLRYQSGTDSLYINGTNYNWSPTTNMPTNTWAHFAVCRASGTVTVYVNGVSKLSVSNSANLVQNTATTIGASTHATSETLKCYVSNFRAVQGNAVYSAAFTPPTSPLSAISGTALLTCQDTNQIIDKSANAFTVTAFGNAAASDLTPF